MNCNSSTCFKLFKVAKATREAQKRYFKTRDNHALRESKALEKDLDRAVENYERVCLNGGTFPATPVQASLFEEHALIDCRGEAIK